jgi:thiamine-phosphate pyrophosphorylase
MICLVTERRRLSPSADNVDRLVDLVGAAARAGIDLVQIRERDLDTRPLVELVARCVRAVDGSRTKVVVNDRADVALAARAHGVHLRADSIEASAARGLLGSDTIIGRSVHGAAEAAAVTAAGGVDYLIFGTLYDTPSKDAAHRVATLDDLRAACRAAAGVPVLAIGGLTLDRAADVARAGAAGAAGIGLFVPPAGVSADRHLESIAEGLRGTFDTCGAVS